MSITRSDRSQSNMKKIPDLPKATLDDFQAVQGKFYIWSVKWQTGEDMVFWGPNGAGYCMSIEDIGIYTANEAYDITKGATNPTGEGLLITSRADYLRFKSTLLEFGRDGGFAVAIPADKLHEIVNIRRVAKI